MKKFILYGCFMMLLIFLLCCPSQAMDAAANGLELCAATVIPSLFPFFILSSLLIKTGFLTALFRPLQPLFSRLFGISPSGTAAFFLGACAGYPIGAKSVIELNETGQISYREANRLLRFCNNAGPLFLVGTVGVGMFGNADVGYLLLFSHFFAAVAIGFLFRKNEKTDHTYKKTQIQLSWNLLSDAVNGAVTSILAVCGYIILFQVIIRGLYQFGMIGFFSRLLTAEKSTGFASGMLSGLIEMTSGASLLSKLHHLPLRALVTAVSAVLGFGGLCVHAQTFGIIKGYNKKTYLTGKILQGMFSAIITYFLFPKFIREAPVFYTHIPTQQELNGELFLTLFLLSITLVFYLILLLTNFVRSKK